MKEKSKLLLKSSILMFMIILFIGIGNYLGGIGNYFFYHIIFCIVLCICIPIYYFRKEDNGDLSLLGIKKLRNIDYIIIIGFVAFSIGGSLMRTNIERINWGLLPLCITPFIMSTICEEFIFRGFLQIRFEKAFGSIPAIIVSGFAYGIYHLGYPCLRNAQLITTLIFVGIMFALSFKLSKNNVIVAYFVNLPNACMQYVLYPEHFPYENFTLSASIISIVITCIIGFMLKNGLSPKKIKILNAQI